LLDRNQPVFAQAFIALSKPCCSTKCGHKSRITARIGGGAAAKIRRLLRRF
jgi:hypothetical protein